MVGVSVYLSVSPVSVYLSVSGTCLWSAGCHRHCRCWLVCSAGQRVTVPGMSFSPCSPPTPCCPFLSSGPLLLGQPPPLCTCCWTSPVTTVTTPSSERCANITFTLAHRCLSCVYQSWHCGVFLPAQVLSKALLHLSMNTAGLFIHYLSDRTQRQSFLETRRCIEGRVRLERENQRQVESSSAFKLVTGSLGY